MVLEEGQHNSNAGGSFVDTNRDMARASYLGEAFIHRNVASIGSMMRFPTGNKRQFHYYARPTDPPLPDHSTSQAFIREISCKLPGNLFTRGEKLPRVSVKPSRGLVAGA